MQSRTFNSLSARCRFYQIIQRLPPVTNKDHEGVVNLTVGLVLLILYRWRFYCLERLPIANHLSATPRPYPTSISDPPLPSTPAYGYFLAT